MLPTGVSEEISVKVNSKYPDSEILCITKRVLGKRRESIMREVLAIVKYAAVVTVATALLLIIAVSK